MIYTEKARKDFITLRTMDLGFRFHHREGLQLLLIYDLTLRKNPKQ
jgi:hypothetical protein